MRSDIERFKQQVARLDLTGVAFAAFRDDRSGRRPALETATEIGRADAA